MKRFWVVLVAMGLIMAFAMPAAAVDVKFNGSWYMAGWYADNQSGLDRGSTAQTDPSWGGAAGVAGQSLTTGRWNSAYANRGAVAFYTHKLRMNTTFQIVEGLALKTQFDALEQVMGDSTWAGGGIGRASQGSSSRASSGVATSSAQENFEFEAAWVDFKTALGRIQAGYVPNGIGFGTAFLIDPYTWPTIRYDNTFGPVSIFASIFKIREWRNSDAFGGNNTNGIKNDADSDAYRLGVVGKFKVGEAGLMYELWRDSRAKGTAALNDNTAANFGITPQNANGWVTMINTLNPYTKLKFGPVYVEAEAYYRFGQLRKYETFTAATVAAPNLQQADVAVNAWGAYIKGQVDFKPFFAGAQFVYMSGDDMVNQDKVTGSLAQLMGDNYAFNQTLILWNFDYSDAVGPMRGNTFSNNPRTLSNYSNTRYMDNVWFYQVYAGINPTAKLNITAKLAYATADKKPKMAVGDVGVALTANNTSGAFTAAQMAAINATTGNQEFVSDKYGTEVDLIANYKIYDNLTYTIGAGYLWVGDYFKGYDQDSKLRDNYIVTHKLTLAF